MSHQPSAISHQPTYGPPEQMVVSMARLLRDGERVFHGVASPLPMIAILLARRLHAPNLVYLNISGGINSGPYPLPFSTCHPALLHGSASIFPLAEVFDLSARGGLDVAFLGGVQIDRHGRINLSVIGDFKRPKVRFPGGAGAATFLPTVKRVILWRTKHNPRTIVEKVDFVTAQGRVDRVITPLCVFAFRNGDIYVESIHSYSSAEEIIKNTGFELRIDPSIPYTPPPTARELEVLEEIDPKKVRLIEFEHP